MNIDRSLILMLKIRGFKTLIHSKIKLALQSHALLILFQSNHEVNDYKVLTISSA